MFGKLSEEMEVKVAASKAWEVYGTLELAKIVKPALPHVFQNIEILEGDGGLGTIFKVTFPPADTPGRSWFKEKVVKHDSENRVKETETIEGGFLDLGFTLYRIRFEIIEKEEDSCIIKVTLEYEVKEEAAANASSVTLEPLLMIMNVAAQYLLNNKS